MSGQYQICQKCYHVAGVGSGLPNRCLRNKEHELVTAFVIDCPHLERTAAGNVTRAKREHADNECVTNEDRIRDSHHFGDPERRHFMVPGEAAGWQAAVAGEDIRELTENHEDADTAAEMVVNELLFFDDADWDALTASEQVVYERKARSIIAAIRMVDPGGIGMTDHHPGKPHNYDYMCLTHGQTVMLSPASCEYHHLDDAECRYDWVCLTPVDEVDAATRAQWAGLGEI